MATIRIPPGKLGALLETHARKLPEATRAGLSRAAEQARTTELARKLPVYRGVLQNAWEVRTEATGSTAALVTNTAPYAGIVERGARPHWTSKEGRDALREWVRLKIFRPGRRRRPVSRRDTGPGGLYEREIESIVWAIVNAWAKRGRAGGFQVRDALPRLGQEATEEVIEQLREFLEAGR